MQVDTRIQVQTDSSIDAIEVAAYRIPTDRHEQDGTLDWDATTMVVVHVRAGDETGLGYTYGDAAIAEVIGEKLGHVVRSASAFAPQAVNSAMCRALRNSGTPGMGAMAIAAVDIALWDLKARLLGISLATLLGGVRDAVPIYGSGGFTSYTTGQLSVQLAGWVADGIPRVKMKVGRDAKADSKRVAAARHAIGDDTELFVDANGAYSRKQALTLADRFQGESNVSWFEEPQSSDDLEGLRYLRDRGPAGMDIAAGEYGYRPVYFRRMLEAGAVDVLQIDVTRACGITGFLAAAALADAYQHDISAHCAPALHTHLGCALGHMRHIEYFHDHVRIESMLLDGIPRREGGQLVINRSAPGMGMMFREADAERFRLM